MASVRQYGTSWQGSYRDASGRRHTRMWPTRTAARKWAQDGEASVRQGTHRDPRAGRSTLAAWHERWLAARTVSDSTRRRDVTYGRDVLAAFGPWPLDSITRMEIASWVRRMELEGRGPAAIGSAVQVLTSLLEEAVREGKIPANPARGVPVPRELARGGRIITQAEEPLLLAALPTAQDRRMVEVLLDTGLRYGELAGLHAHRVDMLRRELHVVEVLTQAGQVKAYPKSRRSQRTIPLEQRALLALAAQMETNRDGLVFRTLRRSPGSDGHGPVVGANWRRRAWGPAVAGLAAPSPLPHSTRRTFATRLLAAGADIKMVQDILGHEHIAVTARYLASTPDAGDRMRVVMRRVAAGGLQGGLQGGTVEA